MKQFEKCADSMFILTNELMAERMPGEAQPEAVIRGILTQSYNVKTDYDYYKALIKICEDQRDRDQQNLKKITNNRLHMNKILDYVMIFIVVAIFGVLIMYFIYNIWMYLIKPFI